MNDESKKQEKTEQGPQRTPGRKLTREDLSKIMGGVLALGCCTQSCCDLRDRRTEYL